MSNKLKCKHNLWVLYFLIFLFVGPIIAAHLLYAFKDHFNFKTMHTGQLLSPAVSPDSLPFFKTSFLGKWQLLYLGHTHCEPECKIPTVLDKIYLALGKEKHRVAYHSVPFQKTSSPLTPGSIIVLDPRGWLILQYPSNSDPKGIVKDIRRLLRVSHGG